MKLYWLNNYFLNPIPQLGNLVKKDKKTELNEAEPSDLYVNVLKTLRRTYSTIGRTGYTRP